MMAASIRWYPIDVAPGDISQGSPIPTTALPDCCREFAELGTDIECSECGAAWGFLEPGQRPFVEAMLDSPQVTEDQVRQWFGDYGVEIWRTRGGRA